MQHCLYSPLPIESYFLEGIPTDSMRVTKNLGRGGSIWNLMWLSHPPLDNIPGAADWRHVYLAKPALYGAIVSDVNLYDTLDNVLHQHPAKFAAWFAKEDHSAWACYGVEGDAWVSTVLARAGEAAVRLASNVRMEGNVVHVKFGTKR